MRHATNLTIGLRLALVEPGKAEALVFALATSRAGLLISGAPSPGFQTPHYAGGPATPSGTLSPRAGAGGYSSAATAVAATSAFAAAAAAAAAGGATRDVSVRQMRLHNTLLASAVSWCQQLVTRPSHARVPSGPCCLHWDAAAFGRCSH